LIFFRVFCLSGLRYVETETLKEIPEIMKKSWFTLIELLVVIAIIAILAGMLLPALGKVKSRGMTMTCVSNQKNCVYALTSYANTFSDYFPASRLKYEHEYGWAGLLIREGYLPKEVEWRSGGYVRLTESSVIKCPTVIYRKNDVGDVTESQYHTDQTYGLIKGNAGSGANEVILGAPIEAGTVTYYFVHRSMLLKPEYKNIPLGGDSIHTRDAYQPGHLGMTLPSTTNRKAAISDAARVIHLRHLGKGNIFYPDGHVDSVGAKDITPQTYLRYIDKVAGQSSFL